MTAVYDIPKNVTAYIIYKLISVETVGTSPNTRVLRTYQAKHYNCKGKYFRGHDVYLYDEKTVPVGVMVDMRSLQLLKWGCCPKELTAEMIEATQSYEDDRDTVEEAALLHKKGYLGGI